MARRNVIGERANGDHGLFFSPPAVDALTAADAALVFNVSSKVSQLLLLGSIAAPGGTVMLGMSQKPFVHLTSSWDFSGVAGHTLGSGPIRPSPMTGSPAVAVINSGGASMDVTAPTKTTYAVYSQAFA